MNKFDHIQDPIVRAEAMRAQAVADMIIEAIEGLRSLVQDFKARMAAKAEYRRTYETLASMTDRELDDIGISRGDIPAVARGLDPRPQPVEVVPGDALARRLALAEAFDQEQDETAVVTVRANDNRPAAAA